MMRLIFQLAFVLALAWNHSVALGQGNWSMTSPAQATRPAVSATLWPSIASLEPYVPSVTSPMGVSPVVQSCQQGCDGSACFGGNSMGSNTFGIQYNGCGSATTNSCSEFLEQSACRTNLWHFSAAGLSMGRSKPSRVWTTYENNNNQNQLMATDVAGTDFVGGVELHLGRQIACGAYVVDLGYWTLDDFEGMSSQTHVNMVSSPLLFNDLEFSVGDPVADYFDSADEHRISRRNTVQNLELNLIENSSACGSCSPWRSRKSVGVRYFQFDEDLLFSTLDTGGTWGGNGGADEVTMTSSTENNLLGVQLGYQLDRQFGQQASFFIAPKFGIYNNRVEHRFDLRRGDGVAAMPSAASGVSGGYPVETSDNVVSFLSELNLGVSWQPTCRWTLFGGYRVMAFTGMALADSQIPQYIIDLPEIQDIDTQDSLVLHGAFFGFSYSH